MSLQSLMNTVWNFVRDHRDVNFRSMWVYNWLLEALLCGGLLILVLLVLRAVFKKRVHRWAVFACWAMIAVRVLLPAAIPNPLMNDLRPTNSTDFAARPVADQIRVRAQDALGDLAFRLQMSQVDKLIESGVDREDAFIDRPYGAGDAVLQVACMTSYGWLGRPLLIGYFAIGALLFVMLTLRRVKKRNHRGDIAVRLLCCLMWLNPLMWIAAHYWRVDRDRDVEEPAGASRAFSILLVALMAVATVCSFCTAETTPAEEILWKNYAALNSEDFPSAPEGWLSGPVPTDPVSGKEQIIERADAYFCLLHGMSADSYTVEACEDGWTVACVSGLSNITVIQLGEDGIISAYERDLRSEDAERAGYPLPGNIDEAMETYLQQLAKHMLNGTAQNIQREAMYADSESTYLEYKATVNGERCTFLMDMNARCLVRFRRGYVTLQDSGITTLLRTAWRWVVNNVHITYAERYNVLSYISEEDGLRAGMLLRRDSLNDDQIAFLTENYGEREVWQLSMGVNDTEPVLTRTAELTQLTGEEEKGVFTFSGESYRLLNGNFYLEDIMPPGTRYTVIRRVTEENAGDDFPMNGWECWLLVQYVSPANGETVEYWTPDPALEESHILSDTSFADYDQDTFRWETNGETREFTAATVNLSVYSEWDARALAVSYGLKAPDTFLPLDRAAAIAADTVMAEYGYTLEELNIRAVAASAGLTEDGTPVWIVCLYVNAVDCYNVMMAGETGEVQLCTEPMHGNG